MILQGAVEYHARIISRVDLAALMTSAGIDEDGTTERILDATLVEMGEHGSEATIDAIAARAGVGRVTVFRRFGSKDQLLQRLVGREIRTFLAAVDAALESVADPAERVAEAFVACVRMSASHPMVARLARLEPGAALERLAAGDPSALDLGRAYVAARIAEDGASTGAASPEEVAEVLVRLAAVYALVPSPVVDVADEAAARDFARRVLAPMVTRG
jgi:AcrR family transcriptional regulator